MIWMMLIVAAWSAVLLLACWGTRRARKADEPVPKCSWCTPAPRGLCSCAARCGYIRCVTGAAAHWTQDELAMLRGEKELES